MTQLLNFDGLVGPNHNYGGLAQGNFASTGHSGQQSSPQQAALQGLEKMWLLHGLGIPQGFIPPQQRPSFSLLHAAGFHGTPQQMLESAFKTAPQLLEACYSASSMWAANAATVTASSDTLTHKLQLSPANLLSQLHRSIESTETDTFLRSCFADHTYFHCHPPLPNQLHFADEGAANHIRLNDTESTGALNLFIYGQASTLHQSTQRYPARQRQMACEALIRRHQIPTDKALLIQQNPKAIDHGAFHNDVVAVGLNNFLLVHENAFFEQENVMRVLKKHTEHWANPLIILEIKASELSLKEAISSYLFNSQLVALPSGEILLLAPEESRQSIAAEKICQRIIESNNPVTQIKFINLKQSMDNGGGPACLRLAIPITDKELAAVNPNFLINETRYQQLRLWIKKHYRDQLVPNDLQDYRLAEEIDIALTELQAITSKASVKTRA